jgi:hypothetical protein
MDVFPDELSIQLNPKATNTGENDPEGSIELKLIISNRKDSI